MPDNPVYHFESDLLEKKRNYSFHRWGVAQNRSSPASAFFLHDTRLFLLHDTRPLSLWYKSLMFLLQVGRAGRQITFDMMLQIANSLKAFHGNVEVSMIQGIDVRGQDVLRAIIIALRSGWRGPSVLDCAGSNLKDEDCNKLAEALTSPGATHVRYNFPNIVESRGGSSSPLGFGNKSHNTHTQEYVQILGAAIGLALTRSRWNANGINKLRKM